MTSDRDRHAHPRVDGQRLARAAHLAVVRIAADRYRVTGGSAEHVVQLVNGRLRCDCEDAVRHASSATVCKHRLAVALHRLPAPIVAALRDLVPLPRPGARRPKAVAS